MGERVLRLRGLMSVYNSIVGERNCFMRRNPTVFVVVGAMVLFSSVAFGHLCNDVFAQAKDNLAVKVDIRDGQLRIGKSASFKVYLLNTMDRDIADIRLEVLSDQFNPTVTHAPDWQQFPCLKVKKKEYFTVQLDRKPVGTDGRIPFIIISGGVPRG